MRETKIRAATAIFFIITGILILKTHFLPLKLHGLAIRNKALRLPIIKPPFLLYKPACPAGRLAILTHVLTILPLMLTVQTHRLTVWTYRVTVLTLLLTVTTYRVIVWTFVCRI